MTELFDSIRPGATAEEPAQTLLDNGDLFVSTALPGRSERRLAVALVLVLAVAFAAAVPFAQVSLLKVPAFIPAYEAALLILDLVTAILLFGAASTGCWRRASCSWSY
jgi:hypothetical protein